MKKLTAIILTCMLIMTGCGNSDDTGNKALDGDLNLESTQSLVIAQVTAIYGNDITLALAEKVDDLATKTRNAQDSSTTTDKTGKTQNSNSTTDEAANSKTSDKSSVQANGTGTGTTSTGEMPTDGAAPSMGDRPSDSTDSSTEESSSEKENKQSQRQMTRYQLTGEEMTATIPVGTPVTTLLGTVTTFSRIAVDNTLQILMEKNDAGEDVIVEIYIVG